MKQWTKGYLMKTKINICLWVLSFVLLTWDFLLIWEFMTTSIVVNTFLKENLSHAIWDPPLSNDYCMALIYGLLILCCITFPFKEHILRNRILLVLITTICYAFYRFAVAWIGLDIMFKIWNQPEIYGPWLR